MVKIDEVVNKIVSLYNSKDGSSGGYGHIVFDDDNIEDHHIEWCIKEAEKGGYELCDDTRQKSILALKSILQLKECDRQEAIDLAINKILF